MSSLITSVQINYFYYDLFIQNKILNCKMLKNFKFSNIKKKIYAYCDVVIFLC